MHSLFTRAPVDSRAGRAASDQSQSLAAVGSRHRNSPEITPVSSVGHCGQQAASILIDIKRLTSEEQARETSSASQEVGEGWRGARADRQS